MFEAAVKLARAHSTDICSQAAQAVLRQNLPGYAERQVEDLAAQLVPSLEMQLRYLETNDLEEWRTYLTRVVADRVRKGLDYSNVMQVGKLIIAASRQFFHTQLPPLGAIDGEEAQQVVAKLDRRLDSFDMVATSITIAVGIREKAHS
jgi:hypothetical protein